MAKAKQVAAATLSGAFLAVRQYLWDGKGHHWEASPKQEVAICYAAHLASRNGAITPKQKREIVDLVMERISPHATVRGYLMNVHGVTQDELRGLLPKIQEYRHAWLIHLSEEFKDAA